MVKVDVFALKTRPYDLEAFSRMRAGTFGEGPDARELLERAFAEALGA